MPLKTDGKRIGRWHPARRAMEIEAQVTRALRGGTATMRAMGAVFLPPDEREKRKPEEYQKRLLHTFLQPAYDKAVTRIGEKPFQRAVTLKNADHLSKKLQILELNCDRRGTNLTRFAHRLFDQGLDTGAMHILVDMPPIRASANGERMNQLVAGELDIRPYFAAVHSDNLVDWSWDPNDDRQLYHITIYEEHADTDPDELEERTVQRLRFYSRDSWEIWERSVDRVVASASRSLTTQTDLLMIARAAASQSLADGERPYRMVASGANALGRVPLRSAILKSGGSDRLHARPPMIDLAWKNLEHWVSSSEQRWALRYGRFPILRASGADTDMMDHDFVAGAGATLFSRNEAFSLGWVELSGGAITAGERDLDRIEAQMNGLASAPLLIQTGNRTATEVGVDEQHTQSEAQSYVESLEWLLYEAFKLAAEWNREEIPDDFDLGIFRDFGLVARSEQDLRSLDMARSRGDVSQETYLRELRKRGPLGQDVDVDEELERTADERSSVMRSAMPFAPDQDQEDEEDPEEQPADGGDPKDEEDEDDVGAGDRKKKPPLPSPAKA